MPFPLRKQLRLLVCVSFSLVLAQTSQAQKSVTAFGEFTAAEQALTECDFDKEAEAVVLLDQAQSTYNDDYNLVTQHRVRIKVLKEAGIERGNVRIRYYSRDNFEFIREIGGVVLSQDDAKKPMWSALENKLIYTKKLNAYYSEISFALPNIKVGSIFEYKYTSQMKHYGGLRQWEFQTDLPVVLSSYNLVILPNAEFAYRLFKSEFMNATVKPDKKTGSVLFEMENIPALKEEAYMGAPSDYLQRVMFQFSGMNRVEGYGYDMHVTSKTNYANTWDRLARELLDDRDFGGALTKSLPGAEPVLAQWAAVQSPFERMRQIHSYVRSTIGWNHVVSKYAVDGLKNAWQKRSGTTGEINLILLNLLKASSLQAEPMLVSARDHGRVDSSYPFIDQFSNVVALVTLDNKQYVLDATDAQTPAFMIPFDLLNTTGFIVRKKGAALLRLANDTRKNLGIINVMGTLTPAGTMQLDASADYYDYSKLQKQEQYLDDKQAYEQTFFAPYRATKIDSFSINGMDADSLPLHHVAKMEYALERTGNYAMLNYNLFTGFDKNPFPLKPRFTDIDFGCMYSRVFNGSFELPDNFTPESLPKSIKLVMPDNSMSVVRQVQQSGKTLLVLLRIDFSKSLYVADEYPDLQAFYKQMIDLLQEPILLKAKS